MKANELMISDWVTIKSNGKVPDVNVKITSLDLDNKITVDPRVCDNLLREDELLPIPITEKILVGNGFFKNIDSEIAFTMDTYVGDCHIWLQFINESIFLGLAKYGAGSFKLRKYIKSVHELQHALRLCGLSDIADNFRID